MLTRIVWNQSRRSLMRVPVRYSSHHEPIPEKYWKFRTGHMDEALIPSGSWKEAYNQQQSKYNRQLVVSTLLMAVTIGYIYTSGVIDFVLPPPMKNE